MISKILSMSGSFLIPGYYVLCFAFELSPIQALIYSNNQAPQEPNSESLLPGCGMPVNFRLVLRASLENVFPQQQGDNMTGKSSVCYHCERVFLVFDSTRNRVTVHEREKKMSRTISRMAVLVWKFNMHNTAAK